MDSSKPNYRPVRKNGLTTHDTFHIHTRKQHQRSSPSTLTVYATGDIGTVAVNGESFHSGVEYSLNKGRRWELASSDFSDLLELPPTPSSTSKKGTSNKKAVVMRAKDADAKSELSAATRAFATRQINEPVDHLDEADARLEAEAGKRRKLNLKDRKAQKAFKTKKMNSSLHNSHSATVYAAGSADVFVAVSETPKLSKIHTIKSHKEGREIQARTHKNQDLARLHI